MKRLLCLIVCFAITVPGLALANEIIAEVEPFVGYVEPFTRDLAKGDKGDDVVVLQKRLAELGYLSGSADGNFGKDTMAAVSRFQKAHAPMGLTESGIADKLTLNLLASDDAAAAVLKTGDKSDAVYRFQQALYDYGFLESPADGVYGKNTSLAVEELVDYLHMQGVAEYTKEDGATAELQELLYEGDYNPYMRDLAQSYEGLDVRVLSAKLRALGYMELSGEKYDDYTRDAVTDFQKLNGIEPTGVADKDTFGALFSKGAVRADRLTRRVLEYGDKGETVVDLQLALIAYGFLSPYTTGRFDSRTETALERVAKFWPESGIDSAKEASTALQNAFLEGEVPVYISDVKHGDESEEVTRIQRRLYTLFYLKESNVDRFAGKQFESAVKQFQINNGLPETGVADEATQRALFSLDAVSNGSKYLLRVSTDDQMVYAYVRGDDGRYSLTRSMVCSTGMSDTPTPQGVYQAYTRRQHEWHYFKAYDCWARYTFIISGNILFHSTLFYSRSENSANRTSISKLGSPASHGCVRLSVEDAKWVYDNCEAKTIVIVHPM